MRVVTGPGLPEHLCQRLVRQPLVLDTRSLIGRSLLAPQLEEKPAKQQWESGVWSHEARHHLDCAQAITLETCFLRGQLGLPKRLGADSLQARLVDFEGAHVLLPPIYPHIHGVGAAL
jgi:hypothetical protein